VEPVNIEAEQSVLGAMLLSPTVLRDVVGLIGPADFSRESHAAVFAAILDVAECGHVDVVTVAEHMRQQGTLPKGDPMFLRDLEAQMTTTHGARHYAEIVRGESLKRRVLRAGQEVISIVSSNGRSPKEMAELAMRTLTDATAAAERSGVEEIGDITDEAAAGLEERAQFPRSIPTKIPWLDKALDGGLHGGRLYVLGSRPSVGKSALATNIVRHALDAGRLVQFVSLEMTGTEVLGRLLADRFNFDARDRDEFARRMFDPSVGEWGLRFMAQASIQDLAAQARAIHPNLIVVDYVQLLHSAVRHERRDLEVASYTRTLKRLAVELRVPILALSQVNRGPEGRTDRRPRMSDLRESGALEADPDGVLILHRDVDAESREAELAVWKNRYGPTGHVKLIFDAVHTRFREMERA
jgi:replicative DNA helicase